MGLPAVQQISQSVCMSDFFFFCLNSGASPVRSDSQAAPRRCSHNNRTFFLFLYVQKQKAQCWHLGTKADEGEQGRESDSDRAIDLPLQKLAEPSSPHWG